MKLCTGCNTEKEFLAFSRNKRKADNCAIWCKDCHKKYQSRPEIKDRMKQKNLQWRETHKDNLSENRKRYYATPKGKLTAFKWAVQKRYGIPFEQYEQIFLEQKGCCAICNRHESNFSKRLATDHEHSTGIVRGLLCQFCNTSLGGFDDREDLLLAAVEYLKKHRKPKLQCVKGDK